MYERKPYFRDDETTKRLYDRGYKYNPDTFSMSRGYIGRTPNEFYKILTEKIFKDGGIQSTRAEMHMQLHAVTIINWNYEVPKDLNICGLYQVGHKKAVIALSKVLPPEKNFGFGIDRHCKNQLRPFIKSPVDLSMSKTINKISTH